MVQRLAIFRGFGTFGIKHRAARQTILIPEGNIPSFKLSKEFKEADK